MARNGPNREVRLPMAPGSLAQVGTGTNQGEKPQNIEGFLTMGQGPGPSVCDEPDTDGPGEY